MQTQRVKVVRSFYFDRKALAVGTVIDLPFIFAREVIASNKAERVEGGQEQPAPARTRDTKPLV